MRGANSPSRAMKHMAQSHLFLGLLARAPIALGALKQGVLNLHQKPINPQLGVLAARNHVGGGACKAEIHQGGDLLLAHGDLKASFRLSGGVHSVLKDL